MIPENTFVIELAEPSATRAFGYQLGQLLRGGDLIVLSGDLGAGKTTLTQGIGRGLGIRGQVASPTFIIAREHPSLTDGPALVHVDAYRLGSLEEVDALDLDTSLDEAVTVVEWGAGLVEQLAQDRLEITVQRPRGNLEASAGELIDLSDAEAGVRRVTVTTFGQRWAGFELPGSETQDRELS